MPNLILYLVVSFLYLAVAVDFWRMAKTPESNHFNILKLHAAMIALGLVLHAYLLSQLVFVGGFNFGLLNALSVIFWLTVLIYWFVEIKHRLQALQALVLPLAAIFVVLPAFSEQSHYMPEANAGLFKLHIGMALLAYSLFTFAALHALLMAIAERSLHNKSTLIKLPSFPPLMVMEDLLFSVITLGFFLLTLTLISGMWFSEEIFGKPLQFNHKVIFSIAAWLIYGWLLFGRYQYGWRGKKAIKLTLVGFLLLLLAYIGSKFVLEMILHR